MNKFGVHQETTPEDKQASDSVSHCPLCGQEVQRHGQIALCPTHGSKPFERPVDRDDQTE